MSIDFSSSMNTLSHEGVSSPRQRMKGNNPRNDPIVRYETAMAQLETRLLQEALSDKGGNLLLQGMLSLAICYKLSSFLAHLGDASFAWLLMLSRSDPRTFAVSSHKLISRTQPTSHRAFASI